jgi:ABC-type phosphate/phosphonate transport system substrate-binding protein
VQRIQTLLARHGISPEPLSVVWPENDLLAHWRSDNLLLSQTCGFPLMTLLPDVQVVGGFHYSAPGCVGPLYRSLIVVREEDKQQQLVDFRARRVVCNSDDSQSGYNALLKMIAPLAVGGLFFSHALMSGSHRQSLTELQNGRADIAAIDCMTWALVQRHHPELSKGLVVIDQSPLAPGLPLITSRHTPPVLLAQLRNALTALVNEPASRPFCEALFISGFSPLQREDYSVLLDWRNAAAALGVSRL